MAQSNSTRLYQRILLLIINTVFNDFVEVDEPTLKEQAYNFAIVLRYQLNIQNISTNFGKCYRLKQLQRTLLRIVVCQLKYVNYGLV